MKVSTLRMLTATFLLLSVGMWTSCSKNSTQVEPLESAKNTAEQLSLKKNFLATCIIPKGFTREMFETTVMDPRVQIVTAQEMTNDVSVESEAARNLSLTLRSAGLPVLEFYLTTGRVLYPLPGKLVAASISSDKYLSANSSSQAMIGEGVGVANRPGIRLDVPTTFEIIYGFKNNRYQLNYDSPYTYEGVTYRIRLNEDGTSTWYLNPYYYWSETIIPGPYFSVWNLHAAQVRTSAKFEVVEKQ
jgi:hypothetical protein